MKPSDPSKETAGRQQPEERVMNAGKDMASDMTREAREKTRSGLEGGKAQAADAVERTSAALDDTAANLAAEGQESLAQVAGMLSNQLSGLAHALERRSLDDLANEARHLAQRNPALFVAGGVALGIALSRFFKASADHSSSSSMYGPSGEYGRSGGYGDTGGYGSTGSYGTTGTSQQSGGYGSSGSSGYGSRQGGDASYGSEAAIPPEGRSGGQVGGSSTTRGGTAGSGGDRNPMGGGND